MSDRKERERRRKSSTSSSSSSSSSDSSSDAGKTVRSKNKSQPSVRNVPKVALDIGYKIQQEELSDSEDSIRSVSQPTKAPLKSNNRDHLKLSSERNEKQDRSKSTERKRSISTERKRSSSTERKLYRSHSKERKRGRSPSKEFRKDRSKSKDIKLDRDYKSITKHDYTKIDCGKDRSRSKERKKERSKSRDRKKRRSRSKEKKSKSPNKIKKRERSRSRDRKRDRREKYRRNSRSPSYKDSKSSRSRSKRERSRRRSRSRSRPRKRSRSRSISFERPKRPYDKKLNKLSILEKLGIELKVPEGQTGEPGANTSGFSIPSYYNPSGVNPLKYAQQMQKRKLIWGSKSKEGETSTEKKEEVVQKPESGPVGPESVWKGTTFSQDQDGKLTAKFKRLMGIKDSGGEEGSEKNSELLQKQEEMFSSMEKQYEVARVSTHTHRGLGLGFGVHLPR